MNFVLPPNHNFYKHLRNEFHFSGVHGAMNRNGSRAKWMNPEGVHVSFASDPLRFIAPWTTEKLNSLLIFTFFSLYRVLKNLQGGHIYQQTENLHTVCVQTAERRRRLQRPIRLARFVFFDVKFGLRHVAWHNVVHGSMNTDEHLMVHLRRF